MFDHNFQYIAGGLALFFITLAVYKAVTQNAHKRAAAAKSLSNNKAGQNSDSNVSFHNPYPNGAPVPEAPQPSGDKPQPSPPAPPPEPANHAPAQAKPPYMPAAPHPAAVQQPAPAPATPQAPTSPEQIYKWN